jgi:hypothetical protein
MKHRKEEILNALKIIRDECEYHVEGCGACPFYVNHTCMIKIGVPSGWRLNNDIPELWRAFK